MDKKRRKKIQKEQYHKEFKTGPKSTRGKKKTRGRTTK